MSLNAFAYWVHSQLSSADRQPFASLAAQWKVAVDTGMNYRAAQMRPKYKFQDYTTLAEVFFTFGFDWTPSNSEYRDEMSPATLFANVDKLSAYARATLACALLQQANTLKTPAPATLLATLLQELINKMRVQGRTAYLAQRSGSAHADTSTSYMGLLALSENTRSKAARVGDPDQLIEKVRAARLRSAHTPTAFVVGQLRGGPAQARQQSLVSHWHAPNGDRRHRSVALRRHKGVSRRFPFFWFFFAVSLTPRLQQRRSRLHADRASGRRQTVAGDV